MGETYSVFEWTIENFSCWNCEIHGNMIPFPKIDPFSTSEELFSLEFFPKGLSGKEEHLMLKICNPTVSGDCELSFIGSNGSLVYKKSINLKKECLETFIGPTFKKVMTEIRNHKAVHEDSLTLRCRIKTFINLSVFIRTVIDIFSTSLKINCEVYRDKSASSDCFSRIQFPNEDGKSENLGISINKLRDSTREDVNVSFELTANSKSTAKTPIQLCISYQQSNGAMLKHEEVEHLLTAGNKWVSVKTLSITENVSYLLLNLKIITGNKPKTYFHWSLDPDKTEITLMANTPKIPRKSTSNDPETSVNMLTKEMMCLYQDQDQDFADFQLHCGQDSIAVHKGILSARSPVFKSLLASDMKEASSGSMDIVDLDTPTLSRFLGFLYSGTVDDLQWNNALKLYYAADKYQVSTLKNECVSVLSADISISNVCEILSLADRHQDEKLTSVAHDFILANYNQVLKSKEWVDFMKVDPELLLKTLTHFAQKDHVGKMNAS